MTKFKLLIHFSFILICAIFIRHLSADSMVAYWSFGEGSGNLLRDHSSFGNDGQILGSPEWIKGKIGKALKFDGVDDFIVVPNSDSFKFGKDDPFSISLWIKYTPRSDWQVILEKVDATRTFAIGIQPDNKLYFAINDGTFTTTTVIGDVSGKWHHCCFVRDTGTDNLLFSVAAEFQSELDSVSVSEGLKQEFAKKQIVLSENTGITVKDEGNEWQITNNQQTYKVRKEGDNLNVYTDMVFAYLDGRLVAESEDITTAGIENKAEIYIGAGKPGNKARYEGMLDEVTIYNRVLTKSEVKQAVHGSLPEVYHESALRRFEIVSTISLPFAALHSYAVVRGFEMIRQGKVSPKFSQTNWNVVGGLTIMFSGFIGFWDWLHVRGEDISEVIPQKPQPSLYPVLDSNLWQKNQMSIIQLVSLSMRF